MGFSDAQRMRAANLSYSVNPHPRDTAPRRTDPFNAGRIRGVVEQDAAAAIDLDCVAGRFLFVPCR